MAHPLFLVIASNLISQYSLPQISIKSWTTNDELNFDSSTPLPALYQSTENYGQVIGIPSSVGGITFFCNATYPIEWNFHHHQLGSFGAPIRGQKRSIAIVSTTRESNDNLFNTSGFEYESELKILGGNNIMTGNYTCQGVGSPDVSKSIYIYWEGSSPPYLTLAGMNISVSWDDQARQVVLPCKVSRQDIPVDLYQITPNGTIPINRNESVTFDPTRGYIFSGLDTPYGQFKCVANRETEKDYLMVHVIREEESSEEYPIYRIIRPASFAFDGDKSQFVCCSRKDKPPAMAHFYCEHPITCQLRKDSLIDFENAGTRLGNGNTCAAIKIFAMSSGVVRCVGDGIDVTQSYIFPIDIPSPWDRMKQKENKTVISQPYYSWDEANPDKLIELKSSSKSNVYYAGQNYTFSCKFSTAYFSHGARWMLQWKNQSSILIEEAVINKTARGYRQIFKKNVASVIVTADIELDFVNCFAPVWNTSDWKNKSLSFTVQEPVPPVILGEDVELVEWYLNDTDKSITCNFGGKPNPLVKWKKDNKTITANIKIENGSSVVEFTRVSYETHGDYICTVNNFRGNATKIFRVIVYEHSSVGLAVVITFIIIGFMLVLFGSGLLAWKLYNQKKIINHLADAAFKEVRNGREDHVTTSGSLGLYAQNGHHATTTGPAVIDSDHMIRRDLRLDSSEDTRRTDGNYHKL